MNPAKGKLYIVSTPIGNLSDITYRAIEILQSVAFVLAEDTRYTKKLFDHYKINTMLVSYRDQNHMGMIDKVYEKLDLGLDLALVSDSGTPLISDPGYRLVHELREAGYEVLTVPGPSALTAAASVSGLPTDRLLFVGFLPKSDIRRRNILKLIDETDSTMVVYESPNRLIALLELIYSFLGKDREISVCRELTKVHEEVLSGPVETVLTTLQSRGEVKGEIVVCIAKK